MDMGVKNVRFIFLFFFFVGIYFSRGKLRKVKISVSRKHTTIKRSTTIFSKTVFVTRVFKYYNDGVYSLWPPRVRRHTCSCFSQPSNRIIFTCFFDRLNAQIWIFISVRASILFRFYVHVYDVFTFGNWRQTSRISNKPTSFFSTSL